LKFWTWLAQLQKQKGTPILTGEQQKRLVEEAGFIDIEVIEKRIDFGSWSEGLIPFPLTCSTDQNLPKDPDSAEAGRVARFAIATIVPYLVDLWTDVMPDKDDRRAFSDNVVAELFNGECRASIKV